MSNMASKVPGWVERILIPTLETKIRAIVAEELAKYGKTVDAKFEAVDARFGAIESKMDARFEGVNTRLDSLEERLDVVKEIAEIKARLNVIEKAGR